jgi:alkanesulfonate monooxygenase SsuD/methylene tetrahydromethanopterin reductase-like flavin-dependent oxidoreductase (luciferase family)
MKVGVIPPMRSAREVVELARIAEAARFWGFGVADTAPKINHGCYPTVAATLVATKRIRVSTQITNPVNHHWSVHGAAARAFEDLAPGRFVLGMGTGDGAVRTVGLHPAKWSDVEDSIAALRGLAPDDLEIHVAASGPKGVAVAGRVATDLELAVGLDVRTLRHFAGHARAAREAAGVSEPLRVWAMVPAFVVDRESDVAEARLGLRVMAFSSSRFCFGVSFDDKGVPEDWQPVIRERLRRFDQVAHRGQLGATNPNSLLFDDHPEIQEYLIERMLAVGTAEQVRNKLANVAREAGLDGIWISMVTSPFPEDRRSTLERLAGALQAEFD